MKAPHLLLAGPNPRKIKSNLVDVVDASAIQAIEDEIGKSVRQLFELGEQHFSFAEKLPQRHWRQMISRLYYGAYNVARAIRLFTKGEYSTDVKDHKRIEDLPSDFPQKDAYGMQLGVLRDDRNLCDYDHTATEDHLILGRRESIELVTSFIGDARSYLSSKGLNQQEEE